jgi:hypothetical protein
MLKSAALLVMLVSAPALAQEGNARTDFATLKKLFTEIGSTVVKHAPGELALGVASVNVSDEIAQAIRTPRENRLKVAPR